MAELLPPTDVVTVAERSVEVLRLGDGTPPIVLVNGAGGPILGWYKVLPALAQRSTVVAFNPPGIGRSDPPQVPQTSAAVVQALRMLLQAVGLAPPYVLVGHSIGGLHVQWFARRHPDEVAAVVLLDATAPADVRALKTGQPQWQRLLQSLVDAIGRRHPFGEVEQAQASADAIDGAGPFPPVPLVVVSGGRPMPGLLMPRALQAIRARHQAALAAMSPLGRQVIATGSRHFPQMSEPALVIRVVLEALEHGRGVDPGGSRIAGSNREEDARRLWPPT